MLGIAQQVSRIRHQYVGAGQDERAVEVPGERESGVRDDLRQDEEVEPAVP